MKPEVNEIIVKNLSTVNVGPYPISEAMMDAMGNAQIDPSTQDWKTTGVTLEWSIGPGETKIFPRYVGKYLMGIYGFLKSEESVPTSEDRPDSSIEGVTPAPQPVTTAVNPLYPRSTFEDPAGTSSYEPAPSTVAQAPTALNATVPTGTGDVKCKTCGLGFKNKNGLGLHVANKHPEVLIG